MVVRAPESTLVIKVGNAGDSATRSRPPSIHGGTPVPLDAKGPMVSARATVDGTFPSSLLRYCRSGSPLGQDEMKATTFENLIRAVTAPAPAPDLVFQVRPFAPSKNFTQ